MNLNQIILRETYNVIEKVSGCERESFLLNGQIGFLIEKFSNDKDAVTWQNLSKYISEYDRKNMIRLKEDGFKHFYLVEVPKSPARSIPSCHYIASKKQIKEFPWSWATDKVDVK